MKKFLALVMLLAVIFPSCKKYLDINKDPNNPIDVNESLLLSPIELNLSDNIATGNAAVTAQNYLQIIAPNQPNPGLWNYQSFNVDFDGDWYNYYVTSLNNLRILNQKAEAAGKFDYAAIAKICSAYTLGTATDIWGDIPYSKAFDKTNFLVPYDPQAQIYDSVQALLSAAIADLGQSYTASVGGDDYFYQGDMNKWKKLAWSLKARYFITLTKAPGHTAAIQADSALVALENGMTSSDDDFKFAYTGDPGSENPLYLLFTPVTTYVLNSTLVDTLKARNDPRLTVLVKPSETTGLYTGRKVGGDIGTLTDFSYPTGFYAAATSPNYVFNYTEVLFIKAEALLITGGYTLAQPAYTNAVNVTFYKLGLDSTAASVHSYVSGRALTASKALEFIMEEKGIANLFNIESYSDWRRTGFPSLHKVDGALSEIPRRMLYPESEILTNAQPQQKAILTDRIWWDQP